MALKGNVIFLPDEKQLKRIEEELGETSDRMDNRIRLIQEWLQHEDHLPKSIDAELLKNFIRLCKFDIGKVKRKLEMYFVSREKFKCFYDHQKLTGEYFKKNHVSNIVHYLPYLTEDGYRIVIVQPQNVDDFLFVPLLKYTAILLDYLLHEDMSSAVIIVYDLGNVTPSILAKVNLGMFRDFIKMYIDVLPFRIRSLHILNMHPVVMPLLSIIKAVVGPKLKERLLVHKTTEDFHAYVPKRLLPKDLGGSLENLEEIGKRWEKLVLENEVLKRKLDTIKLCGPIPEHKDFLKSLESGVDGSFRQLQID